jgi:hypothetical protein
VQQRRVEGLGGVLVHEVAGTRDHREPRLVLALRPGAQRPGDESLLLGGLDEKLLLAIVVVRAALGFDFKVL